MTHKRKKLSLNELTVTSFTTELQSADGLHGGEETVDIVQATWQFCTGGGGGGGYVAGVSACCL